MRHDCDSRSGFTLIEVLIVAMIIATITGMSLMVLPAVVAATKADSGATQLTAHLRMAREQSITERRNVEVRFVAPDRLECWRDDIDAAGDPAGQTLILETVLEQGIQYTRFAAVPDTPDGFGAGVTPVEFTGNDPWRFTSEGQLVDVNGDVVNGTVFLGRPQQVDSARAVTVFGPTALLREWSWNGSGWVE